MIKKLILLLLASFLLPAALLAQQEKAIEEAHAGAQKLVDAMKDGDWMTCFKAMDPRVIVELGVDPEALEAEVKKIKDQAEAMGMQIHEYTVAPAKELHELKSYDISFLSTQMLMSVNGQKVKGQGFLIAVKYKGEKSWVYVDGGQSEPAMLRKFYPELPEDVEFPESKVELLNEQE